MARGSAGLVLETALLGPRAGEDVLHPVVPFVARVLVDQPSERRIGIAAENGLVNVAGSSTVYS